MHLLAAGRRVALAGGGDSLRALALAARDLKDGRRTTHPELILFASWGELQDYAEYDPAGRDLQPLVDLVDTHGTDAILAAVDQLAPEQQRRDHRLHRPQGQRPRMALRPHRRRLHPRRRTTDEQDDNGDPLPGPIDDAEARLAYVAVTRTRHRLDLGGLSWIHAAPRRKPAGTLNRPRQPAEGGRQP